MSSGLRVGLGFDVHPFAPDPSEGDRRLVLGGVTIDGAPGLAGHSDADVAAHAVADALLGAAGLPDLGTLFPASDAQYAGSSSIELLREIVAKVRSAGWTATNVDLVIAAERPKLADHIGAMGACLSDAVGAPVNVKPKHAEGVGAVGRGEGIAAWAVALLESSPPA
ncbi:MAG: 2-C-methyl-D-erythritol 2,4-cyclodiphosphate synthase [Actinobacteria bacterium]|nr:2-C-methyl-D-erythritol 2,4-cyclodiphosphate synthase [Actinomycetota bacterium]